MGNSFRKLKRVACDKPFLPKSSYLIVRGQEATDTSDFWNLIFDGWWAVSAKKTDRNTYYAEYVKNLMQHGHASIHKSSQNNFREFLHELALHSGELLNCYRISKKLDILPVTCQRWVQILEKAKVVFLLPGFTNPALKKAVKTPKLYFTDTGLLTWLNDIPSSEVLETSENSPLFFENYVVSEILHSHTNAHFYHYRNANLTEIELIIEIAGTLHPLRILPNTKVKPKTLSPFAKLDPIKENEEVKIARGGVLCLCPKLMHLGQTNFVIPLAYL